MRPILLLAVVACAPAFADVVEEKAAEAKEEATENGVSFRVLGGGANEPGVESNVIVGAGVAYERDFFDNLIAVELALEGLVSPDSQALVVEAVIEKPIELNDSLGLYVGAGPTVGLHLKDDRALPGAGGLALIGGEWFIAGGFEVFLELDTAFLYFDRPVVEADLGLGALYRF